MFVWPCTTSTMVQATNKLQQLFRLLVFLNQPYMFRTTKSPILRSTFDCIHSFWHNAPTLLPTGVSGVPRGVWCVQTPPPEIPNFWQIWAEIVLKYQTLSGPGSSVGIATDYGLDGPGIESRLGEIFRCPDWLWGPPNLLYNGYRIFPGGKVRLGRAADHSPSSNAAVKKG
jgi:hypothetical protein